METIVTKESLQDMIRNADDNKRKHIIGRACVGLFRRQTQDEQQTDDTKHNNGIGFAGMDAYSGSLTAKYYMKHKTLLPFQVDLWIKPNRHGRMRITKYHRQLNEIANERKNRSRN